MTRIQITIPDHETSKQEEIELLEKLTENLGGSQSYLSNLFTPALFEWAGEMILEDFAPDIYKNYTEAHEKLRIGAQAFNKLTRDLDDHKAAIEEQKKSLILICEESNERAEEIRQLESGMTEMRRSRTNAIIEGNAQAVLLGQMKTEILNLKAALYDFEHQADEPPQLELSGRIMSDEELEKIRAIRMSDGEHSFGSDEPKHNYKYDDQS